ncbi:hypothetical protein SRHO_G00001610 [Serrasalmus rhombeus]
MRGEFIRTRTSSVPKVKWRCRGSSTAPSNTGEVPSDSPGQAVEFLRSQRDFYSRSDIDVDVAFHRRCCSDVTGLLDGEVQRLLPSCLRRASCAGRGFVTGLSIHVETEGLVQQCF